MALVNIAADKTNFSWKIQYFPPDCVIWNLIQRSMRLVLLP